MNVGQPHQRAQGSKAANQPQKHYYLKDALGWTWSRPKTREFKKKRIDRARSIGFIKPAQARLALPIIFVQKRENFPLLRWVLEGERSDDRWLLPDTVHKQMYQIGRRCKDNFDFSLQ